MKSPKNLFIISSWNDEIEAEQFTNAVNSLRPFQFDVCVCLCGGGFWCLRAVPNQSIESQFIIILVYVVLYCIVVM